MAYFFSASDNFLLKKAMGRLSLGVSCSKTAPIATSLASEVRMSLSVCTGYDSKEAVAKAFL